LQHRDFQGLALNPLIVSLTTYLVYSESVELEATAALPDPGAGCALPGSPPEPHMVRVDALEEQVVAFPGELVTHTYTVYNLDGSAPMTISLEAFSEHVWLTEVTGTIHVSPGTGIEVPVRLLVPESGLSGSRGGPRSPEGGVYGTDLGTLDAAYLFDPRMRDNDRTMTLVSPIKILDIEVSPATTLQLNANGWYEPNPLSYTVVVSSVIECEPGQIKCLPDLILEIEGSDRLRAIPVEHPFPGWGIKQTGDEWACGGELCRELLLEWPLTRGLHTITWRIWVQPMESSTLDGKAQIVMDLPSGELVLLEAEEVVHVPKAAIHPVIVIPGGLGSIPPWEHGWLDPIEHTYDPLLEYLKVLGYEEDVSLFPFPYNWLKSVTVTGGLLDTKIDDITGMQKPYVDYSKVDIVAHSMGGLVARAYIESAGYRDDVGTLITLASPHQGIPAAYLGWEGNDVDWLGVPQLLEILWGAAIANGYCHWYLRLWPPPPILLPYCTDADLHNYIHGEVLGLRDLLPTEDVPRAYLVDRDTGDPYPYGWPENPVLKDLNTPGGDYDVNNLVDDPDLAVWAVYSLGFPDTTYLAFQVRNCYTTTCDDINITPTCPLWMHGIPPSEDDRIRGEDATKPNDSGDSIVPGYSAAFTTVLGLETVQEESGADHGNMPKKSEVMQWVIEVLIGVVPPDPDKWQIEGVE